MVTASSQKGAGEAKTKKVTQNKETEADSFTHLLPQLVMPLLSPTHREGQAWEGLLRGHREQGSAVSDFTCSPELSLGRSHITSVTPYRSLFHQATYFCFPKTLVLGSDVQGLKLNKSGLDRPRTHCTSTLTVTMLTTQST